MSQTLEGLTWYRRSVLRKAARIGAHTAATTTDPAKAVNAARIHVRTKLDNEVANVAKVSVTRPSGIGKLATCTVTLDAITVSASAEVTR